MYYILLFLKLVYIILQYVNVWWYEQSITLTFTESNYGRIFFKNISPKRVHIFECSTTRIKWYSSTCPSLYTFPSQVWATECFILCESSLKKCNTLPPLDSFVALGLFLTHQDNSIITSPCGDDQTVKQLHDFAIEHCQSIVGNQLHLIEVLKQVFATQDREYERLLELINNQTPSETLSQAIGQAQSRNKDLKRKYIEIDNNDDNFVAQSALIFFVPEKYGLCGEV